MVSIIPQFDIRMESGRLSLVEELDALREICKFTEAIQKLNTILENGSISIGDRLFISSEKAQLLYDQGYYDRAAAVLQNGLEWSASALTPDWSSDERCLRDLLTAKLALTSISTQGSVGDAQSVCEECVLPYLPDDITEAPDTIMVVPFLLGLTIGRVRMCFSQGVRKIHHIEAR